MRRAMALAFLVTLAGCGGQQPAPSTPSPASLPTAADETTAPEPVDESQYLTLPETGEVQITTSCELQGPDGLILRSELANGGSLQIVRPDGTLDLEVSALPSPEADPVHTNVPSDTTYTEEGGFLSGTSQLWLDDTDMGIQVGFRVRWDDSIPAC